MRPLPILLAVIGLAVIDISWNQSSSGGFLSPLAVPSSAAILVGIGESLRSDNRFVHSHSD